MTLNTLWLFTGLIMACIEYGKRRERGLAGFGLWAMPAALLALPPLALVQDRFSGYANDHHRLFFVTVGIAYVAVAWLVWRLV